MATFTIHGLDGELYAALRLRAARHGRSLSSEAREILRQTLTTDEVRSANARLGGRIAALFADLDGPV